MTPELLEQAAHNARTQVDFDLLTPALTDIPASHTSRLSPTIIIGDARKIPLPDNRVDLVVTSPPYWQKRDYEHRDQIGQEPTVDGFIDNMIAALREWRRVLRPTGSVFLNIGDTYWNRSLAGIPARLEHAARDDKWLVRNRIIWAKESGMPDPAKNRLVNRYEYILHLTARDNYYYDLFGYAEKYGNGSNPGDIWTVKMQRNMSDHLAPFPDEIVERAITLACPLEVCACCGTPRSRIVRRTSRLDPSRPQAKRAMELAKEKGLTEEHIRAVQATGVSDAGKALRTQNGTGRNAERVQELAREAKAALGGYFREFTFAQKETAGWTECDCLSKGKTRVMERVPGVVLDPFMGTGTTLKVARRMGRVSYGVDLDPQFEGEAS